MDTRNFLQLSERVATSGQPTERNFDAIAESGYIAGINLTISSYAHELPVESDIVSNLGVPYEPSIYANYFFLNFERSKPFV